MATSLEEDGERLFAFLRLPSSQWKSARTDAHEYRQAYNAQAVVCADGAQLILTTNLVATNLDAPSFAATTLAMLATIGLRQRVLADTGYASRPAVAALQAQGIDPWLPSGAPNCTGPMISVRRPNRNRHERSRSDGGLP